MHIFKNFIKDEKGTSEGLAAVAVLAVVFIMITMYNSYIDNKMFGSERYFETKEYIVSLEDNLAFSNSPFVLGIGNIDQNIYYFVRVVKSENPLTTSVYKLSASEWNLVEKDNIDRPYLYKKVEKVIICLLEE